VRIEVVVEGLCGRRRRFGDSASDGLVGRLGGLRGVLEPTSSRTGSSRTGSCASNVPIFGR
jgi:hypothetical protein